jgi:hypothetical protein
MATSFWHTISHNVPGAVLAGKASVRSADRDRIVGFRWHGIALFTEPNIWETLDSWGYCDVAERIPYGTWKDLLPLHDAAVAADAEKIDTSPRLYWTGSPADAWRLSECSRADEMRVKMLRHSAFTWVGGYLYRLALL